MIIYFFFSAQHIFLRLHLDCERRYAARLLVSCVSDLKLKVEHAGISRRRRLDGERDGRERANAKISPGNPRSQFQWPSAGKSDTIELPHFLLFVSDSKRHFFRVVCFFLLFRSKNCIIDWLVWEWRSAPERRHLLDLQIRRYIGRKLIFRIPEPEKIKTIHKSWDIAGIKSDSLDPASRSTVGPFRSLRWNMKLGNGRVVDRDKSVAFWFRSSSET